VHRNLTIALALAAFLVPGTALAVDVTPAFLIALDDFPRDGVADATNLTPFILKVSTREMRATAEFDLSAFASLTSARLQGTVVMGNSVDSGVRILDFLLYSADGVSDLADFGILGVVVGSVSYQPPTDPSVFYDFDVRDEIQSLLDGGATFVGLRVQARNEPQEVSVLPNPTLVLEEAPPVPTLGRFGFALLLTSLLAASYFTARTEPTGN
jgi:hypothetical protein